MIPLGEDVAVAGGVFATTTGLYENRPRAGLRHAHLRAGARRRGLRVGDGLRPVIEIMFGDFLTLAMDSLVNQSTKYWFLTQEQVSVPLVIRSVVGAGGRFGAIHSQMPVSWSMGVPGPDRVPVDARRREGAVKGPPRRQPRAFSSTTALPLEARCRTARPSWGGRWLRVRGGTSPS